MMKGVLYILTAYLAGEILSVLTGRLLPASVLGMLVLFAALRFGVVKASDVSAPARLILDNMILFFIPVGAGIMTTYAVIGAHFWAIVTSVLVSTALTMAVVGVLQQKLGKRR